MLNFTVARSGEYHKLCEVMSLVSGKDRRARRGLIRDLMVTALESRFSSIYHLLEPIEWLSDNEPAYISKETIAFARSMGFEVCTTPFCSPESNGMAEAFVRDLQTGLCS